MNILAFDTSNYTTSVAYFDGQNAVNEGHVLRVGMGERGLRQSTAFFEHTRDLPRRIRTLKEKCDFGKPDCVAASSRPRPREDSYMPCFTAGCSAAEVLAEVLDVPFLSYSHQEGHIAAAAYSIGKCSLLDSPLLAWHLSGGTTELLFVTPEPPRFSVRIIGGTEDISAGQLIDRIGVASGFSFPCGREADTAVLSCPEKESAYHVKLNDLTFSLSGVENLAAKRIRDGKSTAQVFSFVFATVCDAVRRVTERAEMKYPGFPVLFSGGVTASSFMRESLQGIPGCFFSDPRYASDNALGIAYLAYRQMGGA